MQPPLSQQCCAGLCGGTWEPTAVLASLCAAHRAAPHFRVVKAAPAPTWDFPTTLRFLLKGFGSLQHLGEKSSPRAQEHPQNTGKGGELQGDSRKGNSFLDLVEGLGTEPHSAAGGSGAGGGDPQNWSNSSIRTALQSHTGAWDSSKL